MRKIIIAEDDEEVLETLSALLTRAGFEVVCSLNGKDALNKILANENHFDVLITDYNMPFMTGGELIREILRAKINFEKIIVVSGMQKNEISVAELISENANIHFKPKPYSIDGLIKLIES